MAIFVGVPGAVAGVVAVTLPDGPGIRPWVLPGGPEVRPTVATGDITAASMMLCMRAPVFVDALEVGVLVLSRGRAPPGPTWGTTRAGFSPWVKPGDPVFRSWRIGLAP